MFEQLPPHLTNHSDSYIEGNKDSDIFRYWHDT